MNFNEYKQRREVKKFFNQNNEYHLYTLDIIKLLLTSIVVALILVIVFEKISLEIGIGFTLFNIITGYACGYACLKIVDYGSEKVGIIAALGYLLGTVLGILVFYYLSLSPFVNLIYCFKLMLSKTTDLFYLCSMIVGLVISYSVAKN